MADALRELPQAVHPSLLIGYNQADDAGVYRINENTALVQTVDFFPPIVDDPFYFGQIAAANALSDIYAMGGTPLTALNILCFPKGKMDAGVLTDVLRGAAEKLEEAGVVVVGGHSVKDNEIKYGVAATGIIDPNKIISNAGARPGDKIFLTKPLGTGLITTGIKNQKVSDTLELIVTRQMAELNRVASEMMIKYEAHAATDITGYGLLGHSYEMAAASGVTIRIFSEKVPLLDQALELAEANMIPGGALDNREFLNGRLKFENKIEENLEKVLFDPQTSGGLLIAIDPSRADAFLAEAKSLDQDCWLVGEVVARAECEILVR